MEILTDLAALRALSELLCYLVLIVVGLGLAGIAR